MPARIYTEPVRLSQRWPHDLLEAVEAAARERGWTATQWLQEAARNELRRQERRKAA